MTSGASITYQSGGGRVFSEVWLHDAHPPPSDFGWPSGSGAGSEDPSQKESLCLSSSLFSVFADCRVGRDAA